MNLLFGNLAGLWALLGIPVILLIHFLQKERREVVTSTLFLLENMQRESKSGIRLERLRNSLPLWLQILAVLLLTWLLTEPRWLRPDSFQRSIFVLDSSASMSAFHKETLAALENQTARLSRTSARHEWILLETDRRSGTLYSGDDRNSLLAAAAQWKPRTGTHAPEPVLDEARTLLHGTGSVVFLTSRPREEIPAGVHWLAVGSPIENCGFTGLRIEQREDGWIWHVLVRNYGQSAQAREWQAGFGGSLTQPQTLRLDPGQTISLSGRFPDDATDGFLQLTGDDFHLDDWLPLARPQPKPLTIHLEQHPLLTDFAPAFLQSVSNWSAGTNIDPDLRIGTRTRNQTHPGNSGIYFLVEEQEPGPLLTAPIIAENHPLMRDLHWQGLLVSGTTTPELDDNDRVLLWQGEQPLIVLRMVQEKRWLFCNFDLRHSNAGRLPAFIISLHRFIDEIRSEKRAFSRENLQTGQSFRIAADPLGAPVSITFRDFQGNETVSEIAARSQSVSTPGEPGFLEVLQGQNPLLQAAVHFADSREADFRDAGSGEFGPNPEAALLEKNTTADFLTPLWLLLLGGVLLSSWRLLTTNGQE